MLAIKNNLMAETAARHLGTSYDSLARSVERLSSGLRINSAKDDAAGLAVRELLRANVAALRQGARNALDAPFASRIPFASQTPRGPFPARMGLCEPLGFARLTGVANAPPSVPGELTLCPPGS